MRPKAFHPAFTLVELLVVIVIIAILVTAVVVASSSFINDAKAKNTRAVLLIVRDAVEQFRNSETTVRRTITRMKDANIPPKMTYERRYGLYPPDELEGFTPAGVPGSAASMQFFAQPGGAPPRAQLIPEINAGGYAPMKFVSGSSADQTLENRDLAAMLLAIELYCEPAATMLAQIPDRNRSPGPVNSMGLPTRFVDRVPTLDKNWTPNDDLQMRLIIDDWGQPLGYMSQRDWIPNPTPANPASPPSSNHKDWNQASTELIQLNGGQPLVFSYGPDGKYQTSAEAMGPDGDAKASLPTDWLDTPASRKIDQPLNKDNVYPDAALNEKLFRGVGQATP